MTVPNQPPSTDPGPVRLAIVGECGGLEETTWRTCARGHGFAGQHWLKGQLVHQERCPACGTVEWVSTPTPFVGPSGRLLDDCLRRAGHDRSRCFAGNVVQVTLTAVEPGDPSHPEVIAGLRQLALDLATFKPHCVLLLGNTALRAFHPQHWAKVKRGGRRVAGGEEPSAKSDPFACKVGEWRGSLFAADFGGMPALKCLVTYHPAAILRSGARGDGQAGAQPEWLPLLRWDVKRAVAEAATPTLEIPKREILWNLDAPSLLKQLDRLRGWRSPLGHDIEGTALSGVTDFSFAWDGGRTVMWVPLKRLDGTPWWPPANEQRIMDATRALLEDSVPKSVFNSLYEAFVWRWAHGITLRGVAHDPMLSWHEFMPELEKRINMAASILTRQSYWGEHNDCRTEEERAIYNCTDSAMNLELDAAILPLLTPGQRSHYELNLSLLEPMAWQMMKGLPFDGVARDALVASIEREIIDLQGELDTLAGISPPTFAEVKEIIAMKRKWEKCVDWPDLVEHAKPSWKEPV